MMGEFGSSGFGQKTATAGTRINRLIPPRKRAYTRLKRLAATCGTTSHTVTALRPLGRTTLTAAAASGQAVVNLTADPGPSGNGIAANDLVAIREVDGITRQYTVQSVSTLAITLTANLVAGAAKGADFWDFGAVADTDPRTGEAHQPYVLPAAGSGTLQTIFGGTDGVMLSTIGADEPILLSDSNGTTAGSIDEVQYAYVIE